MRWNEEPGSLRQQVEREEVGTFPHRWGVQEELKGSWESFFPKGSQLFCLTSGVVLLSASIDKYLENTKNKRKKLDT